MGASLDTLTSRNNTAVTIKFKGSTVGRIQQFRSSQSNNVQVIAELGRAFMVEMSAGVRQFSFAVSTFYVRNDAIDALRKGEVFSLVVSDATGGTAETLTSFDQCMIQSLSRTYAAGAVTIGQDAEIVAIGNGN